MRTLLLGVMARCVCLMLLCAWHTCHAQNLDQLPIRPGATDPKLNLRVPGTPHEAVVHQNGIYVSAQGSLPDSVVGDNKGVIFNYIFEEDTLVHWAIGLGQPTCMASNHEMLVVSEGNRLLFFSHDTGAVQDIKTIEPAGSISDMFLTQDLLLVLSDPDSNAVHILDLNNDRLSSYRSPQMRQPSSSVLVGNYMIFCERGDTSQSGRVVTFSTESMETTWYVLPQTERDSGYSDMVYIPEAKALMLSTPEQTAPEGHMILGHLLTRTLFAETPPYGLLDDMPPGARLNTGGNGSEVYITDPIGKRVLIYMHQEPGSAGSR